MIRHSIGALALAITLPAVTPLQAAKPPQISWGRAGVTLEQYRADAIACGRAGADADIAGEPATQAFVAAEQWKDRNLNMPLAGADVVREQAQMVQRLRPAERIAEVQGVHVSVTERCLTRLGYRRFALTGEQARALRRLRLGTPKRHAFLYNLARDPEVLARQAVDPRPRAG